MNLLINLIAILLLAIPTKAVTLNEGERAPFKGILLPPETAQKMWIDTRERDSLQKELDTCLDYRTDYSKMDKPTWIGVGFLGGILSVLAISFLVK